GRTDFACLAVVKIALRIRLQITVQYRRAIHKTLHQIAVGGTDIGFTARYALLLQHIASAVNITGWQITGSGGLPVKMLQGYRPDLYRAAERSSHGAGALLVLLADKARRRMQQLLTYRPFRRQPPDRQLRVSGSILPMAG